VIPIFAKTHDLKHILSSIFIVTFLGSCIQTGLFEKNVTLKDHAWNSSYKPTIAFEITDTTSAFNYNNLWVKIKSKVPGEPVVNVQQFDLPLSNQNNWTGTGMDDIFEHRILLSKRPIRFPRAGQYEFTLEHNMRENPLEDIMNVGIRLEKTGQQ
jgi:gliding motility-associated lipoprotein GldH